MIVTVSYQVTYNTDVEIDDLSELDDAINIIKVPHNDTSELDEDSFSVLGLYDEAGNEIESAEASFRA